MLLSIRVALKFYRVALFQICFDICCFAFYISTEIQLLKQLLNNLINNLRILNSGSMFRMNSESSAAKNRAHPTPHYLQVQANSPQFISNNLNSNIVYIFVVKYGKFNCFRGAVHEGRPPLESSIQAL